MDLLDNASVSHVIESDWWRLADKHRRQDGKIIAGEKCLHLSPPFCGGWCTVRKADDINTPFPGYTPAFPHFNLASNHFDTQDCLERCLFNKP
jgi:hypothetical protein